jgi:ketosteroid isomerase-like protein
MEAANIMVVQDAYAAFGRGDMEALLACMTDDIRWQPVIGTASHVPFSGARQGKASVAEFFRLVAETEVFEEFAPQQFIAQGDAVVALGHYRAVTRATGRRFESDFVMVFTLKDGRICGFKEFTDSAAINAAFASAPAHA